MGEVYKARDTRLERTVAIKVLPPHVASDSELRQRFEREARTIAALNHPHICVLHDVGQDNGTDFLVMEHLQGETLASRLDKGPLPIDLALRTGIEIADALDKAHRQGIVHRDLKPANVMMTKSGAKLLDFGIAKLRVEPVESADASQAMTGSVPLTGKGTLLGTLQYMAPEQLEGNDADARTDIFALGTMLYEMVTGKHAFDGSSQVSLMAAILEHEPRPLAQLQPRTPPALEHIIQGCLAKSPDDRWQTAHDVMKQLKWIEGRAAGGPAAPRTSNRRRHVAWLIGAAVAVLVAGAVLVAMRYLRAPESPAQTRFVIAVPDMPNPTNLAISPDGRYIAFVARSAASPSVLYVRSLDSLDVRELPGTEGATRAFWSPDSQSIGFAAVGKLKRIEVSGGRPQNICDLAQAFAGGTWSTDGVIVFGAFPGSLKRVLASGGVPTDVTTVDPQRGEVSHIWPFFLPDGRHFLFQVASNQADSQGIYAGSLDSGKPAQLLRAASMPLYVSPGVLLFHRDRTLYAQSFDAQRLALSGEAVRVVDGLAISDQGTRAAFAVSNSGTLLYRTGAAGIQTQLIWYDRSGKSLGLIGAPAEYRGIALSPDDKRVAVHIHQEPTGGDIWILDQDRGTNTRLTFHPSHNLVPTWSRDGKLLAFASDRDGGLASIYRKASSGAGEDELIVKTRSATFPEDWSPDQQALTMGHATPGRAMGIWLWSTSGEGKETPLVDTEFADILSKFSPDGRWVAYTSNASGRNEIYVRPYPQNSGKWQISNQGGNFVRWSRNGKELFYLAEDGSVMVVDVRSDDDAFSAGIPRVLFRSRAMVGDHLGNVYAYDVSADAQRFLINERPADANVNVPITVVLNWTEALTR